MRAYACVCLVVVLAWQGPSGWCGLSRCVACESPAWMLLLATHLIHDWMLPEVLLWTVWLQGFCGVLIPEGGLRSQH